MEKISLIIYLRAASAGGRVSIAVEANNLILEVTAYQVSLILLSSLNARVTESWTDSVELVTQISTLEIQNLPAASPAISVNDSKL